MSGLETILIILVLLVVITSIVIFGLYLLFQSNKDLLLEYKADFEKGKQIVENRYRK